MDISYLLLIFPPWKCSTAFTGYWTHTFGGRSVDLTNAFLHCAMCPWEHLCINFWVLFLPVLILQFCCYHCIFLPKLILQLCYYCFSMALLITGSHIVLIYEKKKKDGTLTGTTNSGQGEPGSYCNDEYDTLLKPPRQFSVMARTLVMGGVLPLSSGAVCVFYCPRRLSVWGFEFNFFSLELFALQSESGLSYYFTQS